MLRRAVGSTNFVAHRFNGGLRTDTFLEFRRNEALKMYVPFLRNSEINFDTNPPLKRWATK